MWWHTQKPDFVFRGKQASPLKSARASVQSTTGSRGVHISSSNAGYTMFWGSVKSTGYPLNSRFPFTSPPVHHVPSHFNWILQPALDPSQVHAKYCSSTQKAPVHQQPIFMLENKAHMFKKLISKGTDHYRNVNYVYNIHTNKLWNNVYWQCIEQ